MSNEIEISGFEELESLLRGMTISDAKEIAAMRLAIVPLKEGLKRATPIGKTRRLVKIRATVRKEDFATVGILKSGAFYGMFQEYGTSRQRAHVGFFETAFRRKEHEALAILTRELLR